MAPWWLRSGSDEAEDGGEESSAPPTEHSESESATEVESEPGAPAAGAQDVSGAAENTAAPAAETSAPAAEKPESSKSAAEDEPETRSSRRRRRRRRGKGSSSQDETREASPEQRLETVSAASNLVPASPRVQPEILAERVMRPDMEALAKGVMFAIPEMQSHADERKIAIFCDLENVALGVRDSDIKQFEVTLVLERLLEKGKIIVKKAYADWERFHEYKRAFHEAAIELIDIPQKYYSGKNSADIKMVVDAMDLCYSKEHLDTFVLISGDSDFSPLVSKLKENNKYVIGVGVKNSSSNLLISNCDEFIYYEDLWRDAQRTPRLDSLEPKSAELFRLMTDAMLALRRENKELLWGSMIKQTMKRKRPSFNEGYYGYASFSQVLEDAERKKLIRLKRDQGAGNYLVTWFAEEW